jgi:hypothetical protein
MLPAEPDPVAPYPVQPCPVQPYPANPDVVMRGSKNQAEQPRLWFSD